MPVTGTQPAEEIGASRLRAVVARPLAVLVALVRVRQIAHVFLDFAGVLVVGAWCDAWLSSRRFEQGPGG